MVFQHFFLNFQIILKRKSFPLKFWAPIENLFLYIFKISFTYGASGCFSSGVSSITFTSAFVSSDLFVNVPQLCFPFGIGLFLIQLAHAYSKKSSQGSMVSSIAPRTEALSSIQARSVQVSSEERVDLEADPVVDTFKQGQNKFYQSFNFNVNFFFSDISTFFPEKITNPREATRRQQNKLFGISTKFFSSPYFSETFISEFRNSDNHNQCSIECLNQAPRACLSD